MDKKKEFALIIDSDPERRKKLEDLLNASGTDCRTCEDMDSCDCYKQSAEDASFVYIGNPEPDPSPVHLNKSGEASPASNATEKKSLPQSHYFDQMVGFSQGMQGVKALISKVAGTEVTVMITGESGTGKELCARAIHDLSERSAGPFVPVNCGAIPEDLLESELFGHEKGSFTGAISARDGRFEMAKGGTLFLDEIGDMPLNMQVKLLRVLQDKTFERVGSSKSIKSDVRVVTATHKDLDKLVRLGQFREDLFYRLNVFPVEVPALRDRREDISSLLEHYLKKSASIAGRVTLDKSSVRSLVAYDWPGNIRELVNLIDRISVLHGGENVSLDNLPAQYQTISVDEVVAQKQYSTQVTTGLVEEKTEAAQHQFDFPGLIDESIDIKEKIKEVEIAYLHSALEQTNWVVAKAAKKLGLQRTTLVEKMRKYGINKK